MMKGEFYNLDLIKIHEEEFDQVYECYLLPSSTAESFQYTLENREDSESELIVRFNKQKESMFIISTADGARCHLEMSETKLSYHLGNVSLREFADCIKTLDIKPTRSIFSRYKNVINGQFKIDELDDSIETEILLNVFVNLRYAASKSSAIYHQLKDASLQ